MRGERARKPARKNLTADDTDDADFHW